MLSEALRNGKIKETAYSSHNNFEFSILRLPLMILTHIITKNSVYIAIG